MMVTQQVLIKKKETEPTLSRHRIFNWFDNLPKICQELFTDAVQISDKRKTIFGKWDGKE
ncbi:hypothetical protein JS55_07935 (plasmid) [Rickettsia felis str. LSU]|nr:hypothetical protein JS55_07935 [Rickettsia felis str. LSU]